MSEGKSTGYSLYFDAKHKVLRVAHDGPLTDGMVRDAIRTVEQFIAEHDVETGILDFTRVTAVQTSADFVSNIATGPSHFKRYLLVAPQDVQFGFARMFQTLRGGQERTEIVRTVEEAYKALKIDSSESRLVCPSSNSCAGDTTP